MFKSRNKLLSVVCSAALLTGVLAGCGGSKESTANRNASKGKDSEPVTLTFLVDNQTKIDGVKAVAEEFEKKYNIKTEFETRPAGGEGDNLVKTRLATGDMTDLVWYNSGSLLQALNPEKNFVDLTNEKFMENVMDDFKDAVSINGKAYGIPGSTFGVGGWLYNKKVYKELGLSVPKTWNELMANNEKIKAAGKTAVIGTYKDDWTSQLIFLADNHNVLAESPSFANDFTANKAKFANTPAALRSFEKLAEIHKKGYMNKDFLATTYDQGLKMLADGKGVQYPMLSMGLGTIATNSPDKIQDIGYFPQPGDSADKNGFTIWMPSGIYVNKNSEHVDAAKKWMEFFVSQEAVNVYLTKINPNGPFAIKGIDLPDKVYPAVKEMLPFFEAGKITPALEFLSPVKGPSLPQITTEVGSGIRGAKDGAKLYDKDVEKQAKQLGLKGW
ncbi:ABC transporter substrate-binding protein [Bacillus sp. USDA818B3_A]|uniref:ABC transporter substrate-binding protein n=1 Tax=Bacillus sp. USDA818B3_A TaxID=2698834 RepID=UPI001368BB21|nr:extracellular solute-binding protein [Bacillus sp. USDA818B3_A]